MQRRKVTFRLYPNVSQQERLDGWVRLHAELYNAALQERIEAYRKAGISISYYDQQNTLPVIKQFRPELVELGSHALQETLRRLDRAFQAFFRRVKAGQSPGFPRFKSSARYSGFSYPDPAGWKLQQLGQRGGTLRLGSGKGAMMIRLRGRHRFADFTPNDLTLSRRRNHATGQDQWYASITLRVPESACRRERTGDDAIGIDLGVSHWANFDDGSQIENPRWLREALPQLANLQRQRARRKRGSHRYRLLSQEISRVRRHIPHERYKLFAVDKGERAAVKVDPPASTLCAWRGNADEVGGGYPIPKDNGPAGNNAACGCFICPWTGDVDHAAEHFIDLLLNVRVSPEGHHQRYSKGDRFDFHWAPPLSF